ncbi:MAG: GGDEF domain-containing protein [Campylobacterota bacterium]|nr:GGDEF domain-containing protein [Campylobacterota bacterium]
MVYKLIDIVKEVVEDKEKLYIIEEICKLCEDLRYSYNIDEMIQNIYQWFHQNYKIEDFSFSLNELDKNTSCLFFKKGDNFFPDDQLAFYFIIDTKTELNAVISFKAKSKKQYEKIEENYKYIQTLFTQITPVLQSGILKKLHIESTSVDTITHVYNRKYILEYIDKTLLLNNEKKDEITFLMVGIDRFKAVIDEFDFSIGDKVLVELAKVIHKNIKSKDIVARLIGDEFLVALLHPTSQNKIETIAQKMIDDFAKAEVLIDEKRAQTLKKTICIGISTYPKDGETIDGVIKNANNFLYEAKNEGRSKYLTYTKEENNIDFF